MKQRTAGSGLSAQSSWMRFTRENVEEALINIKEAIELHLEGFLEDGQDLPQEKELGFTITAQVPVPERQ